MEQESWLSGALEEFSPMLMPAAHALVQAERDVEKAVSGLVTKKLWMKLNGAPSVGFHMLHIAGSIDRLLTYARGENLNQEQFNFLSAETDSSQTLEVAAVLQLTKESIQTALETISQRMKIVSIRELFEQLTVHRLNIRASFENILRVES